MPKIDLDRQTQDRLAKRLARHLKDQFDVEVEPFDALDLLIFLTETLGPYYYNQGLQDAQVIIRDRIEAIVDAVDAIEQPLKI